MNQDNTSELEQRDVNLSINEVQTTDPQAPVDIDVDAPSEDLAERMANAFDRNLDKLIADVQAPPPPVKIKRPKKIKQVKVKKVKIKIQRYTPVQGKDSSFNAFLGRKIKSAFSMAATARKNAKELGIEKKPTGFFLKKALGFEFGGDLINRTRGTLSSDPTAEQDPSLTKGQRFGASIQKFMKPSGDPLSPQKSSVVGTPYTQPSLFDTDKYTQVSDKSLSKQIKKGLKKLQSSYEKLDNILQSTKKSKQKTTQINEEEISVVENLANKFIQVKESVKENNILRSTLTKTKNLQLSIKKKLAQSNENATREASLEKGKDLSGNVNYTDPYSNKPKQKGFIERAIDFIAGNEDDYDDDGGGPGIDIDVDLPDRDRPRRPGARRRLARRRFNNTKRRISDAGQRARKFIGEKSRSAGGFLRKQGSRALDASKSGISRAGKFFVENPKIAKLGGVFGRFGARLTPGLGIAAGGAEAAYRASKGDSVGAGLAGVGAAADTAAAVTAGSVIGLPVAAVATAVSAVTDIALLGKDLFDVFTGGDKPRKKMSEGGTVPAMVGEAGPELITPANGVVPMSPLFDPASSSISTILGATDKVIRDAGPSAAALKPFISQTIGPLAKIYGKPQFNLTTKVGKNLSNVKEPNKDEGIFGFFKKLVQFFTGSDEGGDGSSSEEKGNPGTAPSDAGAYKDMLDLIAGVESTSSGGYEAFNRGGSAGGTVAHGSGNSSQVAIGGSTKPLTQRTVAEVMRLQESGELHATGRYQIIASTLKGLMNGNYGDTGVKPNDLYDPVTQDKLGIALIKYRLKTGATAANFRNEWIGLQKVPDDKLTAAINNANAAYQANPNATATPSSGGSSPPPAPSATPPRPAAGSRPAANPSGFSAAVQRPSSNPIAPMSSPATNFGGGLNIIPLGSAGASGGYGNSGGYGGYMESSPTPNNFMTIQSFRLANN